MKRSYKSASDRARRAVRCAGSRGYYRYVRLRWQVLFTILDWIGAAVFALAKWWTRPRAFDPIETSEMRSILLLQLDHLGDAVITTSMLPALRRRFPAARIDVLAAPWNRAVFDAAPEVNRVFVSEVNRFARRIGVGWILATIWWGLRLRRVRYDLGIDVRGEFPMAAMLWIAGARRRVGWRSGGGAFLLTESAEYSPGRPEVLSRHALLKAIGASTSETPESPTIRASETVRANTRRLLESRVEAGQPLVVLHVGAGTAAKRWPAAHWQELAGRIVVELGGHVVLVGETAEREMAAEITAAIGSKFVLDLTSRLTLDELAAMAERCGVFVGADSGPGHVAAAAGAHVIALFSGTNLPEQWRPWGPRVMLARAPVACSPCHRTSCPWVDHPCMQGIAPGRVLAMVESILTRTRDEKETRRATISFERRIVARDELAEDAA